MNKYFWIFILLLVATLNSYGQKKQTLHLTLDEVINMAHQRSLSALIAKYSLTASKWEYNAYKAEFLPSLNFNTNLGNFNRSLTALQDAVTGEIRYIENNNLRNNMNLSIDQNISFTGGTIALYSNIERLDQFNPNRSVSYYTQPLSLSYVQPIGGFNAFKWMRKIEPKKYELAKRQYVESMESVTISVVEHFFNFVLAQQALELSRKNYKNTKQLYEIATERYNIGKVTKSDLMQLELRLLNDDMSINNSLLAFNQRKFLLKSYIGITEDVDLSLFIPFDIPDITINYDQFIELWNINSSFATDQQIRLLNAQRDVAQAKGNQGIKVRLDARFGLTQTGPTLGEAYRSPFDQEVFGLSLSVPILDWGLSKGRVQMAKSKQEVVETQLLQDKIDKEQDILIKTLEFNGQRKQCEISLKANEVAEERYNIAMEQFKNGSLSVTELNQAQTEKDAAVETYISELKNYWYCYYNIRRLSLYDYINQVDIVQKLDESLQKN